MQKRKGILHILKSHIVETECMVSLRIRHDYCIADRQSYCIVSTNTRICHCGHRPATSPLTYRKRWRIKHAMTIRIVWANPCNEGEIFCIFVGRETIFFVTKGYTSPLRVRRSEVSYFLP